MKKFFFIPENCKSELRSIYTDIISQTNGGVLVLHDEKNKKNAKFMIALTGSKTVLLENPRTLALGTSAYTIAEQEIVRCLIANREYQTVVVFAEDIPSLIVLRLVSLHNKDSQEYIDLFKQKHSVIFESVNF